ncbi:conjugative transposon protein TraM [Pedobacter sp.]|uniref:conjugative transposon protein TraM n=1 Tax=Pedobacter sp. TaxID=1411316 RepID=UPI00396C3B12
MEREKKTIRQRRFLLVLPILVLPFLTAFFWALGGGKSEAAEKSKDEPIGFNLKLPDAAEKEDKIMDKMSYYDKAKQDSLKFQELIKNDPNYREAPFSGRQNDFDYYSNERNYNGLNTSLNGRYGNNPNEQQIYRKLAELNGVLNSTGSSLPEHNNLSGYNTAKVVASPVNTDDVDRLEKMMQMMNQSNGEDPEMQQLNGMLERILDIQHPDRVQDRLRKNKEVKKGQVYPVVNPKQTVTASVLESARGNKNNVSSAFFSLEEIEADNSQNAIKAVVHENQTLVNGSTIKLRLVNDVQVNGITIPKGNFLFGIASLNGERLGISIENIRFGNSIFPVELTVFDLDGLDGIYIPGAITRDVAKQSADRSLQTVGLTSLDPSWEMQAAGAGIEAAKSLLSKKVKLVKVTVKAGYQVLLRDEKQKQNLTN